VKQTFERNDSNYGSKSASTPTVSSCVHIVISDQGWILERYANEIAKRIPSVTYDIKPNREASIQYYVTYNVRRERVSSIEIALFTHLETAEPVRKKFFSVAHEVDRCVCMSEFYKTVLADDGVRDIEVINPGVDLDLYRVGLKIGVVGRAYNTGRKGEHLIAEVMNIPEIEWHFTGSGWPGPALELTESEMPNFYRSMDYILVASLYEGGPMCVPEALACGTPVIAPPVGWVPQLPHIEFELGNAESLRAVLLQLVASKNELRRSVLNQTWDNWALQHDRLFTRLVRENTGRARPATAPPKLKVGVVMTKDEANSRGGPSTRVPETVTALNARSVRATYHRYPFLRVDEEDIIHYYNNHPIQGLQAFVEQTTGTSAIRICSPIFLNTERQDIWHAQFVDILCSDRESDILDEKLIAIKEATSTPLVGFPTDRQDKRGEHARVASALSAFDQLICLSLEEKERLTRLGLNRERMHLVHNFCPFEMLETVSADLFAAEFGLRDYVLCVGRIEPRKNQAMIIHSLRETDIPVVLIGHSLEQRYTRALGQLGNGKLHIIPRLPPRSELLRSAYSGARVFCLPSWSEGASIAALEAGSIGCPLVLSDQSSEVEYFQKFARYSHPADSRRLKEALLAAWEEGADPVSRAERSAFVRETYTLERHTTDLLRAYQGSIFSRAGKVA
jgi:glycosyltransferase involved in cell wall biosynthesis